MPEWGNFRTVRSIALRIFFRLESNRYAAADNDDEDDVEVPLVGTISACLSLDDCCVLLLVLPYRYAATVAIT